MKKNKNREMEPSDFIRDGAHLIIRDVWILISYSSIIYLSAASCIYSIYGKGTFTISLALAIFCFERTKKAYMNIKANSPEGIYRDIIK